MIEGLMQEYKQWAVARALPYVGEHFELVGFWVNTDETPEVVGKPPRRARFGNGDLDHRPGKTGPDATSRGANPASRWAR